jgi:hypothetical protein
MQAIFPIVFGTILALATPIAKAQDADPAQSPEADESVALATGESSAEVEQEAADLSAPFDARDVTLEDFLWVARPVIVFADTPADPRVREQLQMLAARPEPLLERDVVIIVDTDPAARSEVRTTLRPRGFALVVLQKDGNVGFRRPSPRDVREIIRGIDNFQLRQEEQRMQLQ